MTLITRRALLANTTAFAIARPALALEPPRRLRAAPAKAQLAPAEYAPTEIWAYEDALPGPELRVRQGDRLARVFMNALPQASTVHWHGLRLENAMDGVAGLTQDPVAPGAEFLYDFAAPDAGTYWYHPHHLSGEQLDRGLSGALIVEEAAPPEVDRDLVLMIDDWRLTGDAVIDAGFDNLHDAAHAGRIGNWITVNGSGEWRQPVRTGERLRLRLISAANARIFTLSMRGVNAWVVALDGQPLAAPEPLGERFALAPAQRVDLIADVTAEDEALLASIERDGGFVIAAFPVEGKTRDEPPPPPAALPPNPVPALGDVGGALAADLVMEGGAMGRMEGAILDGRRMGMRELADAGMVWAFNGVIGMTGEPLLTAARGRTVRIRMVNDTAFPHAMHLHGHHFRRVDGGAEPGPLRDTILMNRGETAEIAFVADNPGKWMLHCHMLEHQASGMMTWIEVA